MNHSPIVSIIVPCYNSAPYLSACIDSLKNQSLGMDCLQLIFVDDASSDHTLDILRAFESSYPDQVLLLPLSQNQGQGFARNLALTYALGTYVLYVDADDLIAPYALELLLNQASRLCCEMLEFDFVRTLQPWVPFSDACNAVATVYQVKNAASRQVFCTSVPRYGTICNKLYRREFLTEHDVHNAEHLAHEDTLFSQLASFYVKTYAYLPVPCYFYRPNPNSTMLKSKKDDFRQFDRLKVQLQFLEECQKRELFKDHYLAIEAMFLRTYYMDTLLFVLERFETAPIARLQEMQDTVRACFPSWQDNPFLLHRQTALEQVLPSTLEHPFTIETFDSLKNAI